MNNELSISQLIMDASPTVQFVMLFLVLLSVISWTIIFQRGRYLSRCRKNANKFENDFWKNVDLNVLYQECIKKPKDQLSAMDNIFVAGFKEFARMHNQEVTKEVKLEQVYRAMKVSCARELEELENHLPTLATIGSISPYIGLFGTVWGIMSAFIALSAVKNATLAMVAPPIAEALIATAMGLVAAIPAVLFYNRYVVKVEKLENQYLNFMDEFSTILNRVTAQK